MKLHSLFEKHRKDKIAQAIERDLPLRPNLKNPGLASAPLIESGPEGSERLPPMPFPAEPSDFAVIHHSPPAPAPAAPPAQSPLAYRSRVIATPPQPAAPVVPLTKVKALSLIQLQTYLFAAITMGHDTVVSDLITQGADINQPRADDGITPIMMASIYGYPKIIAILYTLGARINDQDDCGWTALMHAVKDQQPKSALALIQCKADLDIPAENGETPVQASILKSDTAMLEMLLDAGASVDTWDMHHETPLMTAVDTEDISKEPRMTRMVLAKNPDLGAADTQENTALFHAIRAKSTRLVGLLLKAGADPNQAGPGGVSPLEFAKSQGLVQIRMQIYWHGGR